MVSDMTDVNPMTPEQASALRRPFPPEAVGHLPRAGTTLDYVGHAAITDRLLQVDPCWTWEPVAFNDAGEPLIVTHGSVCRLWIRLTVAGVTRYGVGTVLANAFDVEKQLIGDALRNGAMRFGVGLDMWSKEELEGFGVAGPVVAGAETSTPNRESGDVPATPEVRTVGDSTMNLLKSRVSALVTDKVEVSVARKKRGLPSLSQPLTDEQAFRWKTLLDELEAGLEAPFA